MSVAGLGLIGAGAHAVFYTSTTSSQQITAGTLSVGLSANGATCTATDASGSCTALTLAPVGPTASSFLGDNTTVTATNNGNVNADELVYSIGATYPTSPLASELSVCVTSTGLGTGGSTYKIYNGSLSGAIPGNWGQQGDYITVGGPYSAPGVTPAFGPTDNYAVQLYAGPGQATACGTSPATTPTLNNDAMGESIAVSATMTYSG
jgi:hypothetical protein